MNKDLLIRTISASVLLVIVLTSFQLWGINGLVALGLIVFAIGIKEYANMFFAKQKALSCTFVALSYLSLTVFYFLGMDLIIYSSLFVFSLITFLLHRKTSDVSIVFNNISTLFLGYFYTVICPFLLMKIILIESLGTKLLFSVLLITFSCDIFAYISGRAFGKKLFLPSVSPKKTVAGAIGGLCASVLCAYLSLSYFFELTSPILSLIIGLSCGAATQCGDFFASLLKRVSGVKDSGRIMPGHGGVLDRFDGLYFSGPVFYMLWSLSISFF
jgi:phosphatidate cytidylyltransferase